MHKIEETSSNYLHSPFVLDNDVVVRVVLLHRRRRDVEAPAPDLDLLLAVLGGRLGLVESGQGFYNKVRTN